MLRTLINFRLDATALDYPIIATFLAVGIIPLVIIIVGKIL